jgi:hypothetical protein
LKLEIFRADTPAYYALTYQMQAFTNANLASDGHTTGFGGHF